MLNRDEFESLKFVNQVPKNPSVNELASHQSLFGTQLDEVAGRFTQDSTQKPSDLNNRKSAKSWLFF